MRVRETERMRPLAGRQSHRRSIPSPVEGVCALNALKNKNKDVN